MLLAVPLEVRVTVAVPLGVDVWLGVGVGVGSTHSVPGWLVLSPQLTMMLRP